MWQLSIYHAYFQIILNCKRIICSYSWLTLFISFSSSIIRENKWEKVWFLHKHVPFVSHHNAFCTAKKKHSFSGEQVSWKMRILRALIILQKATNKMFLLKKQVFLWLFQVNSLNDSIGHVLTYWLYDLWITVHFRHIITSLTHLFVDKMPLLIHLYYFHHILWQSIYCYLTKRDSQKLLFTVYMKNGKKPDKYSYICSLFLDTIYRGTFIYISYYKSMIQPIL